MNNPEEAGVLHELVREHLQEAMSAQSAHIEMYAAAFLKQVGSTEASKYRLVNRYNTDTDCITWSFELRDDQ
jgi:hypothetical protein